MQFKNTPQQARKLLCDALRSREYKQGKGCLRRKENNLFCCLGVACDLFLKHEGMGKWVESYSTFLRCRLYHFEIEPDYKGEAFLPELVRQWLGFCYVNGEYINSSLAMRNDNNTTFEEIAAIIESEPEGLLA